MTTSQIEWIANALELISERPVESVITFIIVSGCIGLIIFFAIRELICWYFKMNKTIKVLKETQCKTERQLNEVIRLLDRMLALQEESEEVVTSVEEEIYLEVQELQD